eukprot:CAMPEP_0197865372 /NCGR_PEP_ID=MMETSP1438-20131217/43632_1 /TAXON_ID=1461541 /ORGANISM="Pterosperma sp., Strain CCMP1384" /LENGTH=124 /DNA_ID=CAMNT_0043483835 /DNA_START=96 /DNA_END=467 /DNA_ORIENTATION=-
MAAASSSSAPLTAGRLSGLWLGESKPAPELEGEVPTNPIKWSLCLIPEETHLNAFGAGYFDDAGDIPDQPTLFYTLRGKYDPQTAEVNITKVYERPVEDLTVTYKGKLTFQQDTDGQPSITGTW